MGSMKGDGDNVIAIPRLSSEQAEDVQSKASRLAIMLASLLERPWPEDLEGEMVIGIICFASIEYARIAAAIGMKPPDVVSMARAMGEALEAFVIAHECEKDPNVH